MIEVRTTRNGFHARTKDMTVDTTAAGATLRIERRGVVRNWERYHDETSGYITLTGQFHTHLNDSGSTNEAVFEPRTGQTIAEYTERNGVFSGYVIRDARFEISQYSNELIVRGDSFYTDSYDEWVFHAMQTLETLEHAEVPKPKTRSYSTPNFGVFGGAIATEHTIPVPRHRVVLDSETVPITNDWQWINTYPEEPLPDPILRDDPVEPTPCITRLTNEQLETVYNRLTRHALGTN